MTASRSLCRRYSSSLVPSSLRTKRSSKCAASPSATHSSCGGTTRKEACRICSCARASARKRLVAEPPAPPRPTRPARSLKVQQCEIVSAERRCLDRRYAERRHTETKEKAPAHDHSQGGELPHTTTVKVGSSHARPQSRWGAPTHDHSQGGELPHTTTVKVGSAHT
eukprot:309217-Chlamydomonas_euryale.AAC.1